MEWIEPKTDWTASDYFNSDDYNRIISNVAYLKAYLDTLFVGVDISSMGEEKNYMSHLYAREMNAIESNISVLNNGSYKFAIGESKTYKANGFTPTYEDFNRIESAILRLYETAQNHKANLPRLALTLGQKGVKV